MVFLNKIQPLVSVAYQTIRKGGLVLFPSNVGYALFGHSDESMQLMYRVKQRPYTKPCVIICNLSILDEVSELTQPIRKAIELIVKDYPCAFIIPARETSYYFQGLGEWTRQHLIVDSYVAVFLNIGDSATQLVSLGEKDRYLIIGSSANHSGTGNNYIFDEVEKEITDAVQGSYDAGPSLYAHPQHLGTTIVNFRDNSVQRKGILYPEIVDKLRKCDIMLPNN